MTVPMPQPFDLFMQGLWLWQAAELADAQAPPGGRRSALAT
jgi:hypothetical protein